MSELAFDANGDPIAFPADAEELRVRRFRNPGMRGACEVVHDQDGAPLYVPVDLSYLEFRKVVEAAPGRYRLDPVDASRRVIANSLPAYVTIAESPRAQAPAAVDDRDSVIRELARANADMAKTIADRFASVMQAAADLLRAADGAGLPRREPPPPPTEPEDLDDEEDEEGEDDEEDGEDGDASPNIAALIEQLLPMVQMWLASKVAERSAAAPPAAAPTSAPPAPTAPAPAAAPSREGSDEGATAGPAADVPRPVANGSGPASQEAGVTVATAMATAQAPVEPDRTASPPSGPPVGTRNAAPTAAQQVHLLAIYSQLAAHEKRVAQLVVTRMTPEVRAEWLAELSAMSVNDAVALVRSMIPELGGRKESDS